MTYEKYDILIDRLNSIPFRCGNFWPKKEDVDIILKEDASRTLDFLLWVLETAEEPTTEEDKESKKYIKSILYENLKLID